MNRDGFKHEYIPLFRFDHKKGQFTSRIALNKPPCDARVALGFLNIGEWMVFERVEPAEEILLYRFSPWFGKEVLWLQRRLTLAGQGRGKGVH
jgi:hypothetical protein